MDINKRTSEKKSGAKVEILEICEIENEAEKSKAIAEIQSFVRADKDENDEYVLLKVADLDKDGRGYEYLSVECTQGNVFKAIKKILEMAYDFVKPVSVTKRKKEKSDDETEKKNLYIYSVKFIFQNENINKGDYLFHEDEFIQLYGNLNDRIRNFQQPYGAYMSIDSFETKEGYDGEKLSRKENLSPEFIEEVVRRIISYELGASKKDTFITCIGGYGVKIESFGSECEIDFEIEGDTSDETDKLFYEKHKDIQTGMLSEMMYGVNAFSLFDDIKRGLSEQSIISACQLVGYKVWFDDTEKAEREGVSNGKIDFVPDRKTVNNIRFMVKRTVDFLDRDGDVLAMNFAFSDGEENSGYSEVISEGEGEYLTEHGIFILDCSNDKPSAENILKIIVHYILANTSQIPVFDEINKIGIINPRTNRLYYIYTDNLPVSILKDIEYNVICYRK